MGAEDPSTTNTVHLYPYRNINALERWVKDGGAIFLKMPPPAGAPQFGEQLPADVM
jgi:hypothetical protein